MRRPPTPTSAPRIGSRFVCLISMMPALLAVPTLLAGPADEIEQGRIMRTLRALPTERSLRGDEADIKGLTDTAALIERMLTDLGLTVETQDVPWAPRLRTAEDATRTTPNLWAEIPGTTRPEEVLILAAHYDAVDDCPGADDNGTGVAVNLEIARVLSGLEMDRTVRFLFPTAEEVGLVGSFRYVDEIVKPAIDAGEETIVGMISFDGLGYFTDEPDSQTAPVAGVPDFIKIPTTGDFIAVVGILPHMSFHGPLTREMQKAAPELEIFSTGLMPSPIGDMARSDHAPFWRIGAPAIMLTDTANFRTPHYHQPTDTVDTLDPDRLTLVARSVAGAIYEMAGPAGNEEE